jgi:hypothetical protein
MRGSLALFALNFRPVNVALQHDRAEMAFSAFKQHQFSHARLTLEVDELVLQIMASSSESQH